MWWWLKDPDPRHVEQLAHDALDDCGPMMSREQFGTYAWTYPKLEAAGWAAYRRIVTNPH
jgi:hypothetical protein